MRIPFVIRSAGAWALAATAGPRFFLKELLAEGTYQHPTRPWAEPLVVDASYLSTLRENTQDALAHGIKTPFPISHNDGENPEANRGFLRDIVVQPRADGRLALFGMIEVTNDEIIDRLGKDLQDVSVYIDSFGSGDFTPKGDRIVHVALTNYPVYAGQENFVALSASGGVSSIPVLREVTLASDERTTSMKITQKHRDAAKALGVTLAGDEMSVEALDALLDAAAAASKPVEAPPVTEADVPRLLSVDAQSDRYFSAYRKQVEASVKSEVEAAEKSGRLTAPMAEACRTLLSVTHGFALSTEGKAEGVDVPTLVRTILSGIPEKAVVNVDDRQGADAALSTAGEKPPVEPEAFDATKAQEVANRMLAAANATGKAPTK